MKFSLKKKKKKKKDKKERDKPKKDRRGKSRRAEPSGAEDCSRSGKASLGEARAFTRTDEHPHTVRYISYACDGLIEKVESSFTRRAASSHSRRGPARLSRGLVAFFDRAPYIRGLGDARRAGGDISSGRDISTPLFRVSVPSPRSPIAPERTHPYELAGEAGATRLDFTADTPSVRINNTPYLCCAYCARAGDEICARC